MPTLPEYRKSHLDQHSLYFWTATIHQWHLLLANDAMKMEIIASLQWLKQQGLAEVFGYVIMPNHMHLIWRVLDKNGKESPQGSLLKFTAHQFKKRLEQEGPHALQPYAVNAANKKHEFWQRDSLAVPLYSRQFLLQKMNYIHNNPVAKRWHLAEEPASYRFSSAAFYVHGEDEFGIVKHVGEVF